MTGKEKFKVGMAICLLAGLFICYFTQTGEASQEVKTELGKFNAESINIEYLKSTSDIGYGRVIWNGNNFIVDENTGLLYKENPDLTISLYFTDETEDYMYKYNKENNIIMKERIY